MIVAEQVRLLVDKEKRPPKGECQGEGATTQKDRAMAVARKIRAGQVEINGGGYNAMAPFGGYKQSGLGREAGEFGLEDFFELKSMQT